MKKSNLLTFKRHFKGGTSPKMHYFVKASLLLTSFVLSAKAQCADSDEHCGEKIRMLKNGLVTSEKVSFPKKFPGKSGQGLR